MRFKRIYVEITNKCSLNCSFCPKLKRAYKDMSIDEFKHVITEIKPFTSYIYLHLKGEPLNHPQFKEILDIAYQEGIKVNITTNGTKLKEQLEVIKEAKAIRQINVSLQAMEQVKDKEKYLESVVQLIELARSETFCVSLRIWINNQEVNDFASRYIKSHVKELPKTVFWSYDTEFEWPNLETEEVSKFGTCLGTRNHIGILVNGDVVPCCLDGDGVVVFGNVLSESLSDILNKERFLKMYEGLKSNKLVEELCRKCKYRKK